MGITVLTVLTAFIIRAVARQIYSDCKTVIWIAAMVSLVLLAILREKFCWFWLCCCSERVYGRTE